MLEFLRDVILSRVQTAKDLLSGVTHFFFSENLADCEIPRCARDDAHEAECDVVSLRSYRFEVKDFAK